MEVTSKLHTEWAKEIERDREEGEGERTLLFIRIASHRIGLVECCKLYIFFPLYLLLVAFSAVIIEFGRLFRFVNIS